MKRYRSTLTFLLLLGLLLAASTVAQTSSRHEAAKTAKTPAVRVDGQTASPEEVGLSSARLQRIADSIQRTVDDGRLAGAVSLVARHGKIVYFNALGWSDRDAKKPMQKDNIFRICSMSKPITTVAVMMLYEEGRFTLDEPVSDFLPEFKNMKVLDPPSPQDQTSPPGALVDAKRPITIFNLLTHTSGLTYQWNARLGKTYVDAGVNSGILQQEGTIGEGVKKLAKLPLLFQPGDAWEYSLADDVLGRLVEVVSGMPFDKFLEERIFKPLGMQDTYFFVPEDKVSRMATAYTYYADRGLQPIRDGQTVKEGTLTYSADYPYRGPHTYFSGGGGLNSTAEDYYRFCQMLLNGGELNGVRILGRKSVELMTTNHTQGKLEDTGYGLGVGVISDPKFLKELGSIGDYFWGGFYNTAFLIDPKEDMITIFMSQLHPTGGLNIDQKASRLAFQAITD
jgi:CubicO group peptidase (beta-lactamase class C family)